MRRVLALNAMLALLALLAVGLQPAAQASELIAGVKLGVVEPDLSGFDPISTGSIQLGYEFADLVAIDVALEGEFATSLDSADAPAPANEYDYSHAGLFLSIRNAGPIYGIARAGIIETTIEQQGVDDSDSGTAYGLGLGFSTGVRLEVEWTRYEFRDNDMNQLTLHMAF